MKYLLLFFPFLFLSCFEPDERADPYPREITSILDSVQNWQSWFDFEKEVVTHVNPVTGWELAFESSSEGWRILVNSGADWFIHNTGNNDLADEAQMPAKLTGLYDIQSLWPDSTAIGNWTMHAHVYLLARYKNGSFTDHKKIRFLGYTTNSYIFYYEDEFRADTVLINKDQETNFSYFSFQQQIQVYPEPAKPDYDIVFTSYFDTPTLFGQTIPYKVAGVLINPWNTRGAIDSIRSFEEISLETIAGLNFTEKRDFPGFNWKDVVVDISGGGSATYNVKTHYNYIIHTSQNNYFKLRFLSYTLDGRTGFPRFEFSKIE